jgi:hypothetical protein
MATHFEATPNEVLISGAENPTLAARRLVVDDDGVHVVARGGLLGGSREIDLPCAAVVDVRAEEAITYELVVETDDTTYTVTNVTGDEDEAEAITAFVADRAGLRPAGSAGDGTGPEAVSDGGDARSGVGADGADATGASGSGRTNAGGSDGGTTTGGPSGDSDVAAQLREFAQLRDDGIITDAEFERKKRDLLEDN